METEKAATGWKRWVQMATVIILFMIGGTTSVIFSKTAYQTQAEGRDGQMHYFTKPLFFNWCMMFGMSCCIFIYLGQYVIAPLFKKCKKQGKGEHASSEEDGVKKLMTWKGYLLMLIPACCDFLSTYMMNFGLIWVSSSIFQMMKGSIIIFTAILVVLYRKQKLFGFEIFSVIVIVISLAVIGSAAFCPGYLDEAETSLSGEEESTSGALYIVLGIILILIGQFLQAFQTVIEEQALHDISAPVSFVVALEGIYGLIICSILMPIMGMDWIPDEIYEDTKDSFIMLGNNPTIIAFVISYIISVFMFNYTGMMITDYVNAMVRNVMEPLRMITIWIVSVFLYYVVDEAIGEKVGWFTFLEVIGFILLTVGFLMYTKVIRIPKLFKYPGKDGYEQFDEDQEPIA